MNLTIPVSRKLLKLFVKWIIFLNFMLTTDLLIAWPLENTIKSMNNQVREDFKRINLHSFNKKVHLKLSNSKKNDIFSLIKSGKISFKRGIIDLIKNEINFSPVSISLKKIDSKIFKLNSSNQIDSVEIIPRIDGIPFCRFQVKAHKHMNGDISILGKVPNIDTLHSDDEFDWPDELSSMEFVQNYYSYETNNDHIEKISSRKCFEVIQKSVIPSWEFVVKVNQKSYKINSDENEIFRIEPLFLEVVPAKVQAYKYNKNYNNGELEVFSINLNETGYLENNYFLSKIDSSLSSTISRAKSDNAEFIYNFDETEFVEASTFAHANRMFDYFVSLGFNWESVDPITIINHAVICESSGQCSKSNAIYTPASATSKSGPIIYIGNGDKNEGQFTAEDGNTYTKGLQNLSIDSDVVSHEFTHHVVFKVLKSLSGDSLVLHEAIADFFTFASTKDSCLGESICPENSIVCMVAGQCLRTASTNLTYNSETYLTLPYHLRSQMISGMLWDLQNEISMSTVEKIVFKSLDYFVDDTDFKEFIIALLLADKDLNESLNACKIIEKAKLRGLETVISGVECENSETWTITSGGGTNNSGSSSTETSRSKTSSSFWGCGVIASHHKSSGSLIQYIIFMIMFVGPTIYLNLFKLPPNRFGK